MSRTVIAAVDDMFLVLKIRAGAENVGITLRSVRNADLLLSVARDTGADLIIVDLQHKDRSVRIRNAAEIRRAGLRRFV